MIDKLFDCVIKIPSLLKNFFLFFFGWIIWSVVIISGTVIWFTDSVPTVQHVLKMPSQSSTEFLDVKNRHIASYGQFQKEYVHIQDIPKHLIHALIATEDRRFYKHFGIDFLGIIRALKENITKGRIVQGGSTITQQLAKNILHQTKSFDHRDRSLKRKIMEAILAIKIEKALSKEKILEMHLNRAYMGSGTWGLNAASFKYFRHAAKDLNLYESCLLVGLLQAPSIYSPARNQIHSERRGQKVLDAMVLEGFISSEVSEAAMVIPSALAKENYQYSARYFTDWLMDELYAQGMLKVEKDIKVHTTLDLDIQKMAEDISRQTMAEYGPKWGAKQAALVSMKHDGAVQAMIGGLNYLTSPFNRATKSMRQTGSAFKYFVFLTALMEGWCPDAMISDAPVSIGDWTAKNFKLYKSCGNITLRKAFAESVNTSTIRLAQIVGITKIITMMKDLGVTTHIPDKAKNMTLAIGTLNLSVLEITSAFAAMINQGARVTPYGIQKITSRNNKVVYEHENVDQFETIDPEVVQEMRTLLESVMTSGTGRRANIEGIWCGGKSGTSNTGIYDRDLWFVGMTNAICTGVWAGCDKEEPMTHQSGGSPALHIWHRFNKAVIQKKP